MRNLALLQNEFQNYLLCGASDVESAIVTTEKVPASIRLGIYRDAYYLRLLEAFMQDYPVLHVLLGDEEFDKLGRKYINDQPSHFKSVRWFGGELSAYLRRTPLYDRQSLLIEMADFEWTITKAFDAQDCDSIALEQMGSVPGDKWPDMRFTFHPSLHRWDFQWNIVPVWNAAKTDQEILPEVQVESVPWLIWRQGHEVQFCSLTPDAAFLIDASLNGENFGTICEGLCEWVEPESVGLHAASLLKRLVLDDTITAIIF